MNVKTGQGGQPQYAAYSALKKAGEGRLPFSCCVYRLFLTRCSIIFMSTQKNVNSPVASSVSSSPRMSTATRQVERPR